MKQAIEVIQALDRDSATQPDATRPSTQPVIGPLCLSPGGKADTMIFDFTGTPR